MSAREWKPGDVAMVTVRSQELFCTFYDTGRERGWFHGLGKTTEHWVGQEHHVDARPLVVIDPEDREQVERLLAEWSSLSSGFAELLDEPWTMPAMRLRQALREFANPTPPKPDEPTAYLAAVVDSDGNRWHISGGPTDRDRRWYSPDLNKTRAYADIQAVRILSAGVES